MKHDQLHELTQNLGLSLNESEIYILLLNQGQMTAADIISQTNIDKTGVYRTLSSLSSKNLIYSLGQERNRVYAANPFQEVLKLADDQIKVLKNSKSQLETIFTNLAKYKHNQYEKNITIYEGENGYKRFIESRLIPNTLIREIGAKSNIQTYFQSVAAYEDYMLNSYIPQRLKNNCFLKGLMPVSERGDQIEKTNSRFKKEVHILPKSFLLPAVITTWESHIGFYSQEQGTIICVSIKDPLVTSVFNQLFDYIWNTTEDSQHENK